MPNDEKQPRPMPGVPIPNVPRTFHAQEPGSSYIDPFDPKNWGKLEPWDNIPVAFKNHLDKRRRSRDGSGAIVVPPEIYNWFRDWIKSGPMVFTAAGWFIQHYGFTLVGEGAYPKTLYTPHERPNLTGEVNLNKVKYPGKKAKLLTANAVLEPPVVEEEPLDWELGAEDLLEKYSGDEDKVNEILEHYDAKLAFHRPGGDVYLVNGVVADIDEENSFLTTWRDPHDFVVSVDPEKYAPYNVEDHFNEEFWKHPPTLYHATPEENLKGIMSSGLNIASRTRGMTNRGVGASVFTTTDPDDLEDGSYGDGLIRINTKAMKADGLTPYVEREPDQVEGELREALARRVGLEDSYSYDYEYGVFPNTVIVKGGIPAKYLTVESGEIGKTSSKTAMNINVPESEFEHFWQPTAPGTEEEFWAFRFPPKANPGDKIIFNMNKKPVAEAVVSRIEKPGESACAVTDKFRNRYKVHWRNDSFKKLAGKAKVCPECKKADNLTGVVDGSIACRNCHKTFWPEELLTPDFLDSKKQGYWLHRHVGKTAKFPKELAPLVEEAKKYPTFEEFSNAVNQSDLTDLSNYNLHRWGRAVPRDADEAGNTAKDSVAAIETGNPAYMQDLRSEPDVLGAIQNGSKSITIFRAVPPTTEQIVAFFEDEMRKWQRLGTRGEYPFREKMKRFAPIINESKSGYYNWLSEELEKVKAGTSRFKGVDDPAIKVGDFVTLNRNYAKEHGEATLMGQQGYPTFRIVSKRVPKTDVIWNGDDWKEWAYSPRTVHTLTLKDVYAAAHGGKTASVNILDLDYTTFVRTYGDTNGEQAERFSNELRGMSEEQKVESRRDFQRIQARLKQTTYPATLYRAVRLSNIRNLKLDELGISWTWNPDKANSYDAERGGRDYTIQAKAPFESIDLVETIFANMHPITNYEQEITLKSGSPVELVAWKVGTGDWQSFSQKHAVAKVDKQAEAKPLSMSDINAIIREYMPILEPGLPIPTLKVVNHTGSSWLGMDTWRNSAPDNTEITLQKNITYDEATVRRIIAHELCHHEVFLKVYRYMDQTTRKFLYDGHGKEWLAVAKRFNDRFGAEFVTKTSDQNMVVTDTGKEYFLLVWNRGYTETKAGNLWFSWCVRPSPKQQLYINEQLSRGDMYRLFKVTDPDFSRHGAKVGDGWGGLRPGKDDPIIEKLQRIWDEGTPLPPFPKSPKILERERKVQEQADLMAKWRHYEENKRKMEADPHRLTRGLPTPPAAEPEMSDEELLKELNS